MGVSNSYEDIYAHAESNLAEGEYASALAGFQRLSERLSGLKPVLLKRRPALRSLLLISLAKQAQIHHIQGEFEQAVRLYEQLIEVAPESRDIWRKAMALVHIDMGQVESGLDELRAQAVAHPGDFRLWLAIGLECEALDRLDEAEDNLQRAAGSAVDPDDKVDVYLALFDFYRMQGRVDEALTAWEQAWDARGHDPGHVFLLYRMMREVGDLERAHEYLRREKNPLRKGFYRGLLAADENKPDEAVKHWKRVAKMNPLEFDEGHESWAEAVLRVDHPPEEVIAALSVILETGDYSLRELILLAVAEARIGHTDHAEQALQIACKDGMRSRPRREKLSAANWALFDELVADDEIKAQLRYYFEDDPTGEIVSPPQAVI